TFPDYPAEIRAPAGSLAGVSGFQIQFSSHDIRTPGDHPDVLVAMNPAALKVNLKDLPKGGVLMVNEDAFSKSNLKLAGYESNPLEDGSLEDYRLIRVPMTELTINAVEETGLKRKLAERCKNFFALGVMFYLYQRSLDSTLAWIEQKFGAKPEIAQANKLALKKGLHYAETVEVFQTTYEVKKAALPPGTYRSINGNQALAMGFVAAGSVAKTDVFYGSYPITPASDILHELARHKGFGVKTFQAEDEIAAIGATIGAAYGGSIAITGTSGPGVALKSEAIGLAVMTELPMVIVNVQRGGPSTGLPTKTEQADLFQAVVGRNGECPLPVLAPSTPGDCFHVAMEAVRLATKYMTPVMVLSDGYLANGAEPWRVPDLSELPKIDIKYETKSNGEFMPYRRDPKTLSRPWAIPGTPHLEHRIGGLEKDHLTGNVSYDPANHEEMIQLRARKVAGMVQDVPDLQIEGPADAELLILGWGSTYGAIASACESLRNTEGLSVANAHLRYLNPFPANLGKILESFDQVLVPEMNLGQLRRLLRAEYLKPVMGLSKVQGKPFKVEEIVEKARAILEQKAVAR
ncbi:MAG TPA: 2-oxoacid:acceptor oxidoreductase subunit alpha, partial [Pseudodesulfovibrio sp.]|nr:2-oxoacid:acceptor oxidoreductase subunit alpha [Pseudodesulfovibrio sp.]